MKLNGLDIIGSCGMKEMHVNEKEVSENIL